MSSIRLNKYISDSGFCSRREADRLIEAGRVSVNNQHVAKGKMINPYEDEIVVDGSILKPPKKKKRPVLIAFNKPKGLTCTADTNINESILNFIDHPSRLFPVGNIDKSSEGVVILTNDTTIGNQILKSEAFLEKEFLVKLEHPITDEFIKAFIELLRSPKSKILKESKFVFRLILKHERPLSLRKACLRLENKVKHIIRLKYINITLQDINLAKWRYITEPEIEGINRHLEASSVLTKAAERQKHYSQKKTFHKK